jgi:anti-sigma B factor antagonist
VAERRDLGHATTGTPAHIVEAPVTLSITWQQPTNQTIVLTLHGDIDYATAAELRAAISAAATRQPPTIVIDLSDVELIDDTAVGTLIVGNRICRQLGIDLAVRNPSPLIQRLLGMTHTRRHGRRSRVASAGGG